MTKFNKWLTKCHRDVNQGEAVATYRKEEQNPVWTSGYLHMSTLPVSGRKEALGPGNQQKRLGWMKKNKKLLEKTVILRAHGGE